MEYVEAILGKEIVIQCDSDRLQKKLIGLGAVESHPGRWLLSYGSKSELAKVLNILQSLEILFLDEPAGWPPAAVFEYLRDEKMVRGDIKKISWRGPGQPFIH